MNTELRVIHIFVADGTGSQKAFHDLIRFGLVHRFRDLNKIAIPISDKYLTEILFGFSAKDRIPVWDEAVITGQDFKELFITSIFSSVIEKKHEGIVMCLALPPLGKVESYDTVIAGFHISEARQNGLRLSLPLNSKTAFCLKVQVKDDYVHDPSPKGIVTPSPYNPERLKRWSVEYGDFVLAYIRQFATFSSERVSALMKDSKLGIIHVLNERVAFYDDDPDKPSRFATPKDNAFNFLVQVSENTHHVAYSFPPFLVKDADLQKQLKQRYQR